MKRAMIAILMIISILQAGITFGTGSKVNFGNANVGIYGNLKNQGTITTLTTSRISFLGSAQDSIFNVSTFPNLTLNKLSGDLRIMQDLTVAGNINFVSGDVQTGNYSVILGSAATVTNESATSYIAGHARTTRNIGTSTSVGTGHFGGLGFQINNTGSNLGNVTVYRYSGNGSQETIYGSQGIMRSWDIDTQYAWSGTRSVTAKWLSNEDNGNDLENLKVWKYSETKTLEKIENNESDRNFTKNSKELNIDQDLDRDSEADRAINESKLQGWTEVAGATFNTATSPRTTTYTMDAATKYTVNDITTVFGGGMGTEASPWLVQTPVHLDNVRNFLGTENTDKYWLQTADLDLSGYSAGEGWNPIGNNSTSNFRGHYDGQGYTINALYINRPATDYIGLFGYVSGAVISNVELSGMNVTGHSYIAGLVGYAYTTGVTITNCSVSGSVSGYNYVGGLGGYLRNGSVVQNSMSRGSVTANDYCGGLTGIMYSSGIIRNSYSLTNVFRVSGGTGTYFAAFSAYNYLSTITNNYSTGSVTYINSTSPTDKGFAYYVNSCTMTGNFWNTETSGQTSTGGTATGITISQMRTLSTFTNAGWDFYGESANGTNDYWNIHISLNDGYPYLNWENRIPVSAPANIVLTLPTVSSLKLDWDAVSGATGYAVYSSTNPYGTFALDETGTFNGTEWTVTPLPGTKMFYYVTATNTTKDNPRKIITVQNTSNEK